MLVALLLTPLMLTAPAVDNGLPRSDVAARDLEKLEDGVASFFEALEDEDLEEQQEAIEEIESQVARVEKRARLPAPLLAYPGDWELVFEMAKPEVREFRTKGGRGFFRHSFSDPWIGHYVCLLSLPDDYDDVEQLKPAIVVLLPDLGAEPREYEARALELVEAAYDGVDDRIVLVPLGPPEEGRRPDRANVLEIEGSWMTDAGLSCLFTSARVLFEQVPVDRSRIVLDGWREAGSDAFRIGSAFPSFWAGVVNRGGGELAEDMILSNLHGAPVLYVAGEDDAMDLDALRAVDSPASPVTILEGEADPTAPTPDTRQAIAAWLDTAWRDLAPRTIDYRIADIRYQSIAWLKALDINRRAAAGPSDPDFPRIQASIDQGTNTISIDTTNVFELWIYLSDALVDLGEEVTIEVNGEVRARDTFRRSLRDMLENRFYNASIDYGVYVRAELIDEIDANVP